LCCSSCCSIKQNPTFNRQWCRQGVECGVHAMRWRQPKKMQQSTSGGGGRAWSVVGMPRGSEDPKNATINRWRWRQGVECVGHATRWQGSKIRQQSTGGICFNTAAQRYNSMQCNAYILLGCKKETINRRQREWRQQSKFCTGGGCNDSSNQIIYNQQKNTTINNIYSLSRIMVSVSSWCVHFFPFFHFFVNASAALAQFLVNSMCRFIQSKIHICHWDLWLELRVFCTCFKLFEKVHSFGVGISNA